MTGFETSKVTVRIYGQEYTLSAAKGRDRIIAIANHVDEVIRRLVEQGADGSVAKLSMLAAINIAEQLYTERQMHIDGIREKDELRKDVSHYQQLWEEAKRNHLQYKEDAKIIQEQKEAVQEKLNSKCIEVENLIHNAGEREAVIRQLELELEAADQEIRSVSSQADEKSEMIRELREKLKEIEGNYFELQMENIQMKGDLEHYRNSQL